MLAPAFRRRIIQGVSVIFVQPLPAPQKSGESTKCGNPIILITRLKTRTYSEKASSLHELESELVSPILTPRVTRYMVPYSTSF